MWRDRGREGETKEGPREQQLQVMARVTGVGGLETESDTRWRRGCSLHCLDSLAFPPHLLIISPPPPQLQPGKTEIWKKTVRRRKFILSSFHCFAKCDLAVSSHGGAVCPIWRGCK